MNKVIKYSLLIAGIWAMLYLFASFVAMDFSPNTWDQLGRLMLVFLAFMAIVILGVATDGFE